MRGTFNGTCSECGEFRAGCATVVPRKLVCPRRGFDYPALRAVLCPRCRRSLKWVNQYDLAVEHRSGKR